MEHTIAICTTGDRNFLRDTSEALRKSIGSERVPSTEVLVVTKSSETLASTEGLMAAAFRDTRLCWRVLHEPAPGIGRARNVALAKARGDVVSFIDDDIHPSGPSWQEAIMTAFARHPEVGLVTGPITCVPPPGMPSDPWWRTARTDAFLTCASHGDSGPCDPWLVWTANGSFRRSAIVGLRFPEVLGWGAAGRFRLGGEDVWFSSRVVDRGWVAWYEAGAGVEHQVEADRFRPLWLLRRAVTEGRTAAVCRAAEGADAAAARVRASRGLLLALARAAGGMIRLQPTEAFERCLDAAERFGIVSFPLRVLNPVVDQLRRDEAREDDGDRAR